MNILSAVLLTALITSCSTKAPEDPGKKSPPKMPKIVGSSDERGVSFDARQLANELESDYVTEVRFREGSAELTAEAKKNISRVITQARRADSLKTAKLITWGDQEMPTEIKESLSEEQIDLAKRRNDSLSRFIQGEADSIELDRISMAERPGGLKKLVPNEAARIQESLDRAGVPENGEKENGLGKASRSIIIFTRE